ncbi:MAG TPA: ATP-binding protein [Verrucomicrobiae bacterium]|nr:ATP-binding protein [Verrucomicrobiae bacterium]
MNRRSISFRLVAWYAGLLAGIFVLLCASLYLDLRRFLVNDLRESQLRRAREIGNTLLVHVKQTGESYVASQTEDWYDPEINDRFIRITRADGTLIYTSGKPKDGSFNPDEVPKLAPSPHVVFSRELKLSGNKTLLVAALNFKSPGNPTYLVEFGALLDPVNTMLNHLFLQLTLGLPLAVFVITVGGYLLVRRALTPVEQITRAAESITQHNLSERLPVAQTGDELERLSVSLNRMIARLDDAFQNSKRFVADASHELRTPLTILRGELESLAEDPRLASEWRDRAAILLEEAVRLSKIVEQLFALSRLDAGEAQTDWSRFDLAELAKTTAEQMGLLAEDKNISIHCEARQPMPVEGDQVRLKQVVVNLLDNAIKYTPKNGAIQLRVSAVNGHVVLEVEDNGVGISREALPHIFERFYRVDQTRSIDSEGAGLGLSIVKSICTAHGAEVEAVSVPREGSCFRIKLPLSKN